MRRLNTEIITRPHLSGIRNKVLWQHGVKCLQSGFLQTGKKCRRFVVSSTTSSRSSVGKVLTSTVNGFSNIRMRLIRNHQNTSRLAGSKSSAGCRRLETPVLNGKNQRSLLVRVACILITRCINKKSIKFPLMTRRRVLT